MTLYSEKLLIWDGKHIAPMLKMIMLKAFDMKRAAALKRSCH